MLEALDDSFEELLRLVSHYPVLKQVVLLHSNLLVRFCRLRTLVLLLLLFFLHLRDHSIKDLLVVVGKVEAIEGVCGEFIIELLQETLARLVKL